MTDPDDKSTAQDPIDLVDVPTQAQPGNLDDGLTDFQPLEEADDEPVVQKCRDPELRFAEAMAGQRYEDVPHVVRWPTRLPRVESAVGYGASSAALALER